jgi:RNA polymerase sigma-70 factor (ECF subfamily)
MLVALLRARGRAAAEADAELQGTLAALVAAAGRAWPAVRLAPAVFLPYLAARIPDGPELLAALHALRVTDLYLACGCAEGDAAALTAFEQHVLPAVRAPLARLGLPPAVIDDVKQGLREYLFVVEDGPAHIRAYAGRGALARFVQVAAVRRASNVQRRRRTDGEPQSGALLEVAVDGMDPEVAYLKGRYAAEFSVAFRDALGTLSHRSRNVLRLHFGEGLNIAAIGRVYHVHRATVARWIGGAREALLEQTMRALRDRLGLGTAELESLLELVRSRMDVTLTSSLGARPER